MLLTVHALALLIPTYTLHRSDNYFYTLSLFIKVQNHSGLSTIFKSKYTKETLSQRLKWINSVIKHNSASYFIFGMMLLGEWLKAYVAS